MLQNFNFQHFRKILAFGKEMEDNIVAGYAGQSLVLKAEKPGQHYL